MLWPFRIRVARKRDSGRAVSALEDEAFKPPALSPDERLFALGTRTLADMVAPAGADVRRDHLQLDAQYLRVLVVTGYPRTVAAGWLAPLVEELDLPLELSLHVRPLPSGDMVRALGLQLARLESSRRGVVKELESTKSDLRRRSLEAALKHLDEELAKL